MIQIQAIQIIEFRGIRDLRLKPRGQSHAVWGPNGSGKSGVVDAIEFALTGKVSRLQGSGSGGVSLAKHGPHVHRRDDPGAASVKLTITDCATGDQATLTRNVRTPDSFVLEPDLASVRASVLQASEHPEITLSRREIIKFIIAEPGKRAAEIQALLRLESLSSLRATLKQAKSKTTAKLHSGREATRNAERALERHLDVPSLLTGEILTAVNRRRQTLGLEALDELGPTTSLDAGIASDDPVEAFNKTSAISDVDALLAHLSQDHQSLVGALEVALVKMDGDPDLLATLHTHDLVAAGLDQVVDANCPLCEVSWSDLATLTDHLQSRLQRSASASALRSEILDAAAGVAGSLRRTVQIASPVQHLADRLGQSELAATIEDWKTRCVEAQDPLVEIERMSVLRSDLSEDPILAPNGIDDLTQALRKAIDAMPDQSSTANARAFLTIAQERLNSLRSAKATEAEASSASSIADSIYAHYCSAQDQGLTTLYEAVQERFSEFYRAINADDESKFKAHLAPSAQKLDLTVDFYGLGMFPPMAYHSEGHQDGMGVCLYLALMENLLGDEFRLAVLDDVVMSVDSTHRRQFCDLLKQYFPDVQFVITTHDDVWARQMTRSGLIGKSAQTQFLAWNVDLGPTVIEGEDFWDRIRQDLDADNVPAAAACLRRNLERHLADVADQLAAVVAYKASGSWDLGELMSAVKARYGRLLRAAADAANSWNDADAKAATARAKENWQSAVLLQESEQWAVNPAVHYNEWANFSKEDFEPVTRACAAFLDLFTCNGCGSMIRIARVGTKDAELRCTCGAISMNLLNKKG